MSRLERKQKSLWRRLLLCALMLSILLLLSACNTGEGMDLRLFCQRYSKTAQTRARLVPTQFHARSSGAGRKYEAYIAETMLLVLDTGPDGTVHTIALTALPETPSAEFRGAAADSIRTYCGIPKDAAERFLNSVNAEKTELLGYSTKEEKGFRLTYAANAAGRYIRISQLRFLPAEEPELPTLKDFIKDAEEPYSHGE